MQFIELHNLNPKPFVWAKPVEEIEEIMAKMNRARVALLNE